MSNKIAAVILGAGKGTRMKSDLPKVMMPICGKPMIKHITDTLESMNVDEIITIIAPDGDMVKKTVAPHKTCVQAQQLGTGHAVNCAADLLKDFDGAIMVIFGDTPLITKKTFMQAVEKVREGYAVVVIGFKPADAARYGRLKMQGDELVSIVEYKDATDEEKAIGFCNSGCMVFDGKYLFEILHKIGNENVAGEYYLTDAVSVARKMGLKCTAFEVNPEEVAGANTREELALLESYLQNRENA